MTHFALITLSLCQIAWILLGVLWVVRRHDEIPLLISAVLFYVFDFRLWALFLGWASPANLSNFGFDPLDSGSALEVESIAVLGQSVLLCAYMLAQRRRIDVPHALASPELLNWLKSHVITLGVICIFISLLARRSVGMQLASGKSMGFEVSSYLILFSLSLVGIAILIAGLWKSRAFHTGGEKFVASLFFVAIIYLTFQPSMRFQFLGWVVAATIILSSGLSFMRRARVLSIGLIGAVGLFAVAGSLRNAEDPTAELEHNTWERFAFAEDANMLDGFGLLRQVYPRNHHCRHGVHAGNFSQSFWFVLSRRRIGWSCSFVHHLRIRFWPSHFFQYADCSFGGAFASGHSCRRNRSVATRR